MFVGTPGSFTVTTVGYPSVSNHVIDPTAQLPAGLDEQDGMQFTVTGLPASLTFSNLNLQGFATGTFTIQGTPSGADAGSHQVKITAQNGVGIAAQQTLMLNIVGITGVAPTSGAKCNGNYTGTFNGSITVSAGQNCAFYFGGVTGNVSVIGGSFAATGENRRQRLHPGCGGVCDRRRHYDRGNSPSRTSPRHRPRTRFVVPR